jgi:hypothetical protein
MSMDGGSQIDFGLLLVGGASLAAFIAVGVSVWARWHRGSERRQWQFD